MLKNVSSSDLEIKHAILLLLCLLLGCINVSWVQPIFFSVCLTTKYRRESSVDFPHGDLVMQTSHWCVLPHYLIITSLPGSGSVKFISLNPNLCLPPEWSSVGQLPWLSSVGGEKHYCSGICFSENMISHSENMISFAFCAQKFPSNTWGPMEILWATF